MTNRRNATYSYAIFAGVFYIRLTAHNGWEIIFDDDCLGNRYASAQQALDDLCGGHTFSCSAGDTSELGLPDEISEWRLA